MKQRHPQARQKMSRVIDEIGAALFACGATEVSLRLKKNRKDCAFWFREIIFRVNRPKLERLGKLLQPEIRDRPWQKPSGSLPEQTWRMTRRSLPLWGRF